MSAGAVLKTDAFVGRAQELSALRRGLDSAIAGRGRLFMLVGEPGIGKTRLADEISELAEEHSARVLWGRCWESGGAPPFWPWNQLIRSYVSNRQRANPAALELAPTLSTTIESQAPTAGTIEPEQARFQLFDATALFLRTAASDQPLVMILDDLHAADLDSLLLLRFLARELRSAPWLLICTYREVEAANQPAIAKLLSEIGREGQRLSLGGLSRAETVDYIAGSTAGEPADATVEAVYQITEGNPFFLTEVVRLLSRCDGDGAAAAVRQMIPDEVRSAIRQRLAGLSPRAKRLLAIAAVSGREFDATVLEQAASPEFAADELLRLIDDARQANIITAVPGSLRRYSFAHLLVRDTLFDDLSTGARAALHRRVGEALAQLHAAAPTAHLAEIAHHFGQAATGGCVDQAVDYSQRAGDHALTLLAYEEAARNFQRALDCLELRRMNPQPDDSLLRCTLLLALGDAQWGAGDLTELRSTFQSAARVAEMLPEQQRGPLMARAALGLGGRQQRAHVALDETVVQLLEAAQSALAASDSALRARVLARLAYALYSQPHSGVRRRELCATAVEMARRAGDPMTLRWVLNDWRWALWGPDNLEDRLRIGDELAQLADRIGDREMQLTEHAWRLVDSLELGDIAAVRAELKLYSNLAQQLRLPWYHWYVSRFTAMLALLEGRFAEAEQLAETGLATAQRVQHQDARLIYATQMMTVRIEQGRLEEIETGLQALVAQYPSVPVWRYLLTFLHAGQGREAQAQSELNRVAAHDFTDLADDYLRLANLAYLAEAAALLGDAARAAQLYDLLIPYADRCVVIGYGISCLGPLARHLGLLAMTLERWDDAERHFESALETNTRLGARPGVARTQLAIAEMFLRRPAADGAADADQRRRATDLLQAARTTIEELGMQALLARLQRLVLRYSLGAPTAAAAVAPAALAPSPTSAHIFHGVSARFRRDGEYWEIAYGDGSPFQLKNLRGLAYLAHLLQHPQREFHATQMVALFDNPVDDAGGEMERVRSRVVMLQEELAAAEAMNDLGRSTALQAELDKLVDQLLARTNAGAGGSPEKAAERARVSVTKRISIALQRLAAHDPALARYLEVNVKTGNYCSYLPDPALGVRWDL